MLVHAKQLIADEFSRIPRYHFFLLAFSYFFVSTKPLGFGFDFGCSMRYVLEIVTNLSLPKQGSRQIFRGRNEKVSGTLFLNPSFMFWFLDRF